MSNCSGQSFEMWPGLPQWWCTLPLPGVRNTFPFHFDIIFAFYSFQLHILNSTSSWPLQLHSSSLPSFPITSNIYIWLNYMFNPRFQVIWTLPCWFPMHIPHPPYVEEQFEPYHMSTSFVLPSSFLYCSTWLLHIFCNLIVQVYNMFNMHHFNQRTIQHFKEQVKFTEFLFQISLYFIIPITYHHMFLFTALSPGSKSRMVGVEFESTGKGCTRWGNP